MGTQTHCLYVCANVHFMKLSGLFLVVVPAASEKGKTLPLLCTTWRTKQHKNPQRKQSSSRSKKVSYNWNILRIPLPCHMLFNGVYHQSYKKAFLTTMFILVHPVESGCLSLMKRYVHRYGKGGREIYQLSLLFSFPTPFIFHQESSSSLFQELLQRRNHFI